MSSTDSPREAAFTAAQDDRVAAEFHRPHLKRDPGPGRGLLEQHRDRLSGRGGAPRGGSRPQLLGPIDQVDEVAAGDLVAVDVLPGTRFSQGGILRPLSA